MTPIYEKNIIKNWGGQSILQIDLKERLAAKSVRDRGCLLWKGTLNNGFGQMNWNNKKQKNTWYVHRLAYVIAHGPVPDGFGLKQTCGDKTCIEPTHLVLIEMPWISYKQDEMRAIYDRGGIIEVERPSRPRKEKPPKPQKIRKTDEQRFRESVRIEGDCWIFSAREFWAGGKMVSARQFSYSLANAGKAPRLLTTSCSKNQCVNPSHIVACKGR